jgi:photosystem II stability/assembly factor-like uncharacterized protein
MPNTKCHIPIHFLLRCLLTRRIPGIFVFVFIGLSPVFAQWQAQSQNSGTTAQLRGISAVSGRVAWASGTQGTVLRTVDGGKQWEKVSVPGAEALDFRDIQAFDAEKAFVLSIGAGEQSRIYKTMDGGKTWKLQFTNPQARAFYDCFAFWDSRHGIAMSDSVDGRFPLLATSDGETWEPLKPRTLPEALPNEGGFAASGTCVAVSGKSDAWFVTGGPAARVFHSANRGADWEVVNTPILSGASTQGIFSVAFADRQHGVIVGGDYKEPNGMEKNAACTSDGGKTWALADKPPAGYRSAVALVPRRGTRTWIAVGTSGAEFSEDCRNWQPILPEKGSGGEYNALSLGDSRFGWAVGPQGRIVSIYFRSAVR